MDQTEARITAGELEDRINGGAFELEHAGEWYTVTVGTGDAQGDEGIDGCFAYLAEDIDLANVSDYTDFCSAHDPCDDEELAKALLSEQDLLLNIPGLCVPVLSEKVEDGDTNV